MSFLDSERAALETYIPGLDGKLASIPLMDLEQPGSQAIGLYRDAGGAGMLVPAVHRGGGASAVDAVRVTRALAVRSPSLAIATTMHQFSLASLVSLAEASSGFEWLLLEGIAVDGRLMASGFSEGRANQSILEPTMSARRDGADWVISGVKKPCSLSRSMDLLTASVALPTEDGGTELGVALIPAESPGIEITPFWGSWVLAGAESDAVTLTDVRVPAELVVRNTSLDGGLDDLQTVSFVWFELLVAACYLGVASALVERALAAGKGPASERAALATTVEGAAMLLEGAARDLDAGECGDRGLARSLMARFTVASLVGDAVRQAVELLGGMAFISSGEVAYLAAASHAIGFHPPSRLSTAEPMVSWLGGGALNLS